jgi:hypothetical protein
MKREQVLALYEEGVEAIEQTTAALTPLKWGSTVCGDWTATDLAGHLVCVIGWYNAWLDRAIDAEAKPPFPVKELAQQNQAALAALPPGTGPDRITRFASEARRYAIRLNPSAWYLPYGYPVGTATAGLHAGVAASEWNLHAWDFSHGMFQPQNPRDLFVAAAQGYTRAQAGAIAKLSYPAIALSARRKPWESLLKRSGR